MALIEWSNNLNTGVDEIDNQHRKLVEIINRLNDSIITKTYGETINNIFIELVDYTKYHFESEEIIMREVGYEDFENHKKQHEKFVDRLIRLKHRTLEASRETAIDLCSFLSGWIVAHILHSDKHISEYVKSSQKSFNKQIFTI